MGGHQNGHHHLGRHSIFDQSVLGIHFQRGLVVWGFLTGCLQHAGHLIGYIAVFHHRQAGESTRRVVTRTSLALSFRASL